MAATGFIHQIPFHDSLIHWYCTSLYQLLVQSLFQRQANKRSGSYNKNRSKEESEDQVDLSFCVIIEVPFLLYIYLFMFCNVF